MNPFVVGALVAAVLLPVPPPLPGSPAGALPTISRGAVAGARPGSDSPRAVWPLDPRPQVVAGFDPPSSQWSAGHRGVDLLGVPGAAVRAALAGRIAFAGEVAGRGVVVVDHGPYRTTYEPVRATVRRGARVSAGQTIGTLQSARGHCPPRACLHWGLVVDGAYRDPLSLIGSGAVRLLPW